MNGAPASTGRLDPESRAWLAKLHAREAVRDGAIRRLHTLLLHEARYEVAYHTARLAHPSGRDLEDLAVQAADDALVAILAKLDQFRGDALFTTWARRFVVLEVPAKVRRRLGHTRETPIGGDNWPPERARHDDPERVTQIGELARTVGRLIAQDLTARQREVLIAMAIDGEPAADLAARLHCTPGALYKTLHDARVKLRHQLHQLTAGGPIESHPLSTHAAAGSQSPLVGAI